MITLGVIKAIDSLNNFCTVRLPTLEGAGNKVPIEISATQMLPPGVGAGFEEGDVVFVSFVDNTLSRPVILGQLYKGPGKGTRVDGIGSATDKSLGRANSMACTELDVQAKATCDELDVKSSAYCNRIVTKALNVTSTASLPSTTEFTNAESTYNTPQALIDKLKELEAKVSELEEKNNTLTSAIIGLCTAGTTFTFSNLPFATACVTTGSLLGLSLALDAVQEMLPEDNQNSSVENPDLENQVPEA